MTARGRGLRTPSATARFGPDGVVLRVDDDRTPEFWLELHLSFDELYEMLTEVHDRRQERAAQSAGDRT